MNCNRARRLLSGDSGTERASRSLRYHLAACAACAGYSRRLDAVRAALGDHHTSVAPPAGFALGIQARLGQDDNPIAWDDNPISWAALRLLPASLGLVLLLSWLNLRAVETTSTEIADPTTAVLSWVLEPALAQSGIEAEQPLPTLSGGDG